MTDPLPSAPPQDFLIVDQPPDPVYACIPAVSLAVAQQPESRRRQSPLAAFIFLGSTCALIYYAYSGFHTGMLLQGVVCGVGAVIALAVVANSLRRRGEFNPVHPHARFNQPE